ncbi:hypothetical protein LUZ60_014221 [Juncus effusus]|nr:hypothetical protein LUZ60_014221 [Juncus effusus]
MQRWSSGVGRRLFSSSRSTVASNHHHRATPVALPVIPPRTLPLFADSFRSNHQLNVQRFGSPFFSPYLHGMQIRGFAKKVKGRSRAPATPIVSKVKKYKLKAPSSFKFRFRTMKDGQIRRWRSGKRHNAFSKSKEAKRRLRKPALVHPAYAKVIKKLNFCG